MNQVPNHMPLEPMALNWPGPQEPELAPYVPLSDWPAKSLLVLAPHPDDEVIACGGLLALAARRQIELHVVIVSDGAKGGDPTAREFESQAAAMVLSQGGPWPRLEFWRLPDRELRPDADLRDRIAQIVRATDADWVIAPSPFEVHPDHRAVCRASIEAMASMRPSCPRLMLCEIGQPLIANTLVDITSVLELKRQALRCFVSQLALQAYDEQILGLNRQRSYTLGPQVTAAEAYWFVDPEHLASGVQGVLSGLLRALQRRM